MKKTYSLNPALIRKETLEHSVDTFLFMYK